jgi:hypothetical protein
MAVCLLDQPFGRNQQPTLAKEKKSMLEASSKHQGKQATIQNALARVHCTFGQLWTDVFKHHE